MMEPVRKEVWVAVPVDDAFRRFTEEIAMWWPMATHSLGGEACVDVRFEDGRLVEADRDGTVRPWGDILAWEPPRRVSFTWQLHRSREQAGTVEVTFQPDGAGTRVRLVHSGWDRLGEEGPEVRAEYDQGWTGVLGRYETTLA